MGIFNKFLNEITESVEKKGLDLVASIVSCNNATASGEVITIENSTNINTVYSCAEVVSNAVAKLSIHQYKTVKGNRVKVDNNLSYLIETRPNSNMSAFVFKKTLVAHMLLWGNAYVYIQTENGNVKSLCLLSPELTTIQQNITTGAVSYITNINSKPYTLLQEEVIHIKGFSLDGIKGKSKIDVLRESLGNSKSAAKLLGNYYKNGTLGGGVISHIDQLNDVTKENIKNAWQKTNAGVKNAGNIRILDMGLTYVPLPAMSLVDSQFLENAKFTKEEICSVFGVPPHMVGSLDKATFSNIESQQIQFYTDTIQPIVEQIEDEFNYKLFLLFQRQQGYIFKFSMQSAMRGDSTTRANFYKAMSDMGAMNINEVRALEELNNIGEVGDKYRVDLNHVNVEVVDEYQLSKSGSEVDKNDK